MRVHIAPVVAAAVCACFGQAPAPDLILRNGKVVTLDDHVPNAEAVAVRGDRIVAVGSSALASTSVVVPGEAGRGL